MQMREIFKTPWGHQKVFVMNEQATVKILDIEPFQSLSVQYHTQRSEQWYTLSGDGVVTIDGVRRIVSEGEHLYIPKLAIHTVEAGADGLRILEYVTDHFSANDIVRISDKYGRVEKHLEMKSGPALTDTVKPSDGDEPFSCAFFESCERCV
jgi:mannose-6-phosphate isomerase-like protein (cupin superfamily)